MRKLLLIVGFVLTVTAVCLAQTSTKSSNKSHTGLPKESLVRSSPAYAELLLRFTELESDLESLLVSYTEEFPKVKENRFELSLIKRDMTKILSLNQADSGKLTLALGKLLVRRAEIETDLWAKRNQYGEDHPEVKRGKKKVEVFDKAIKEILP